MARLHGRFVVYLDGRVNSAWEVRDEARLAGERLVAGRPGHIVEVIDRRRGGVIERHDTRTSGRSRARKAGYVAKPCPLCGRAVLHLANHKAVAHPKAVSGRSRAKGTVAQRWAAVHAAAAAGHPIRHPRQYVFGE